VEALLGKFSHLYDGNTPRGDEKKTPVYYFRAKKKTTGDSKQERGRKERYHTGGGFNAG